MATTRSVLRSGMFLLVGVTGVVALSGSSCQPPPSGTTTTASTSVPGNPPAGCYSGASNQADYLYSGTPNVLGNMKPYVRGGGCTVPYNYAQQDALVVSPAGDPFAAGAICASIGGPSGSLQTWSAEGWTGLPPTAWGCSVIV
jgi:hypothetical protein